MTNTTYSLNDLRDIVLPEPVSFWPPAIGFWVLFSFITIIATYIIWLKYKSLRANAYRRAGLLLLQELKDNLNDQNIKDAATDISIILKRVALAAYPRREVASLTGTNWLNFLNATCDTNSFTENPGLLLGNAIYQPDKENIIDKKIIDELLLLAQTWIKQHKTGEPRC